ncbi:MAG: GTP 3',8-cyclase MoaA [Treponema sp.]|jgi:cyclic pyranopterin phosphate synthase|nr:GTP 3',8-cyclase MoaA [Treponema sp.]
MLIDFLGRTLDYLRVSVTGRCNLRCIYCMPPEGVEYRPHEAVLRFEEILRLCRIMAGLGIRRIKVTGGEPLVRKGVVSFIRALAAVPGIEQVTLTTNGVLLDRYLDGLAAAPVSGINVSLNSLNPETFRRLTGCMSGGDAASPAAIVKTMERVRSLGIPVKVNCIPLRNANQGELADIAALAEKTVDAVRFIELMPLGYAETGESIPGSEVRSILERRLELHSFLSHPVDERPGNGPAVYFAVPGFSGRIGFIDAVSRGFCETCNRLRLTPEGLLKPCLASGTAADLRALLRSGASNARIAEAVRHIAALKPASHHFSALSDGGRKNRSDTAMFRIGG